MQHTLLPDLLIRRPLAVPVVLAWLILLLAALPALAQPSISSLSPASGASGSNVVISGSNFSGVTSVRFGELSAKYTVNSSSQITAVVPRAASTQPINVTTSGGYAISPSAFTVTRSSSLVYGVVASNFGGVSVGSNAAPAVADIDGDNLLDLLVGRADGTISRYEQTSLNGSGFSSLGLMGTGSGNINMGSQATVTIVDLDGDGLLSLVLGRGDGTVSEYEQTGLKASAFALATIWGGIATPSNTVPCATDLGSDPDLTNNSAMITTTVVPPTVPAITALSPTMELPGMPITITGTDFTASSTVRFGGVAATSVTFTSSTLLTAIVPVGAAPGSQIVVVASNGQPSTATLAVNVLSVYAGTASCRATTAYPTTGDGLWHYLLTPGGEVVAALNDSNNALGDVTVNFQATGSAGAVRQDVRGRKYLDRNFWVSASNGNAFPGQAVQLRF